MIAVGQFAIFGDWDDTPTPEGLLRIVMPPLGHIDGAGWSPYTQAGLLSLPEHITQGCSFAEIGAGSGILSVAARLLGAGYIVATELDKDALAALPRVFEANQITSDFEIIDGTFPRQHVNVALCSISTKFGQDSAPEVDADVVLNVNNDGTVVRVQ
jgi:ribosomal protein L11 methylase PrmA